MGDVRAHYDGSAPTYHEQYDPEKIWTNAEYPLGRTVEDQYQSRSKASSPPA